MFDVPDDTVSKLTWDGDIDLPDTWQIGLIVGPSGSGKTSLMTDLFGTPKPLVWSAPSVVDDFPATMSMSEIADACASVGFNTIPAWRRPFSVLSNGEQFRVTLARLLVEHEPDEIVVVDEFSSVVDRQVAKIASHAVQKMVRSRPGTQLVVASCHYDIIDWLQPDWILEMPTMRLERRALQRRPDLHVAIQRVDHAAWELFAPYHYLTAEMNRTAKCFVLSVYADDGTVRPASFCGTLHRPHAYADDIEGASRTVTLPDWQGLGLAHVLCDTVASAFVGIGKRFHSYPAHPAFIRDRNKSPNWMLIKKPGKFGGRPNAVFRYVGPAMDRKTAHALISGDPL
jgi:ABC-type thiamine transport system ATPase subunit